MGVPVTKAVIPAAGVGTRFLPLSKAIPKEMAPLLDRPIIAYTLEEAFRSGIRDVLIITSSGKESVADYFDYDPGLLAFLESRGKKRELERVHEISRQVPSLHFIRQGDPKGLGHAVGMARHYVQDEPFAVLLPDELFFGADPALSQLSTIWSEEKPHWVGLQDVPLQDVSKYGIAAIDQGENSPEGSNEGQPQQIHSLVEKPAPADAPSRAAVVGRYVLHPEIFEILETLPRGHGGEIQLTDALAKLAAAGRVWGRQIRGDRHDVGTPVGLFRAWLHLGPKHEEHGADYRRAIEGARQRSPQ